MTDDFDVDVQALRDDASRRWSVWARELETIAKGAEVRLTVAEFGLVPGAAAVFYAIADGTRALSSYITDGQAEFEGIARALIASAKLYEGVEEDVHRVVLTSAGRLGLT
jgi:hypothetical protein